MGTLCSSGWPTAELLIALLGRWLGSQGFPHLGNPFPMASVAHRLLVHNIKGERYQEADRHPERMVGDGGGQGAARPQLDLTQVLGLPTLGACGMLWRLGLLLGFWRLESQESRGQRLLDGQRGHPELRRWFTSLGHPEPLSPWLVMPPTSHLSALLTLLL